MVTMVVNGHNTYWYSFHILPIMAIEEQDEEGGWREERREGGESEERVRITDNYRSHRGTEISTAVR